MKPVLRFKEDQTFTIVQFTDIHWRNGDAQDLASRQCMEAVLDLEQPDLVVFTGDIIYTGRQGIAPQAAWTRFRLSRMPYSRRNLGGFAGHSYSAIMIRKAILRGRN